MQFAAVRDPALPAREAPVVSAPDKPQMLADRYDTWPAPARISISKTNAGDFRPPTGCNRRMRLQLTPGRRSRQRKKLAELFEPTLQSDINSASRARWMWWAAKMCKGAFYELIC